MRCVFNNNKTLVSVDLFELDKMAHWSLPTAVEDKRDKYSPQ